MTQSVVSGNVSRNLILVVVRLVLVGVLEADAS